SETPFVERLADDDAVDAAPRYLLQLREVAERGDAARGRHAQARLARNRARLFEVRARERAVARNVRVDDSVNARVGHAACERPGRVSALLLPTVREHDA